MVEKLRDNFKAGIEKLKWFSSLVSERLKVELAVMRLISDVRAIEEKRNEAQRAAGERLFELKAMEDASITKDRKVEAAMKDIERLNAEIESIRERIAEIGGR